MKRDPAAIAAQTHAANAIVCHPGRLRCDFELREVPLATGEDR